MKSSLAFIFPAFVFLAACAGPPERVTAACRAEYNGCLNRCSQNPTAQAQQGDGHGMPVEPGEPRTINNDTAAESCLTSCRGDAQMCDKRVSTPAATMPSH